MTIFLAGPKPTDAEESLLADECGHLFRLDSYGQPATVKLLNNTLATYNLAATARILNLAVEHGVPAKNLADVIAVSTGTAGCATSSTSSTTCCSRMSTFAAAGGLRP